MKKTNIFLLAGIWIVCLTGCSYQIEQDITGAEPPAQSAEAEETALQQLNVDFASNRIPIADYKNQYENEIKEVEKSKYDNISFGDCEIVPINDEVEKVGIYQLHSDHMGVEESIETIKSWLKEIGCEDVDLEKELRAVSQQYEWDDNKEYPYSYPGVYEHDLDFESGDGFFLDTDQCYIQIIQDGISRMSDGTIAHYLKSGEMPASDAYGGNQEKIVDQGTLSEKKDDVWELPGGKMSVGDAAKVVKDYFEAGTPRKPFDGITVDISEAVVYALDDKYGYAFRVHRVYQGVPFACEFSKDHQDKSSSGGSCISEDSKVAYIINPDTVAAFAGYTESEQLRGLVEEQTEIIGFKDAVSLLNNFFAAKVKLEVQKAELVYCPFSGEDRDNGIMYPCWQFKGINTANDRGLVAYVNVLSGDVYYYSYWGEAEEPF